MWKEKKPMVEEELKKILGIDVINTGDKENVSRYAIRGKRRDKCKGREIQKWRITLVH